MEEKFPFIELSGTSKEIGLQHGEKLKGRIHRCVEFYKKVFKMPDEEILEKAAQFRDKIRSFSEEYAAEIEAIARGAGIDSLWIYALNARTEILSQNTLECTALYSQEGSVLAQNWDWAQDLEDLAVIMKITRKGKPTIIMMTEPGIIGKVGMNSAGIGVTLTMLKRGKLDGLPIHILLRAALDSFSIEEFENVCKENWKGTASNILVGDGSGSYLNVEFANQDVFYTKNSPGVFVHTNHYLSKEITERTSWSESSFLRYDRATELVARGVRGVEDVKKILLDTKHGYQGICRDYHLKKSIGTLGTVCSVIMDLSRKRMHITRGNPLRCEYEVFNV